MPAPVDLLLAALNSALSSSTFVRLTLSKSRGRGDVATQAQLRLVTIRGEPHVSVRLRYPSRDITVNHALKDTVTAVRTLMETAFENANLCTTTGDHELRTNNKHVARFASHKPSFNEVLSQDHDRPKRYVLDPADAPYLAALGLTSPEGHIRSDKADKYRQTQNIVKLLDDAIDGLGLAQKTQLRVVDIGCGKAYLTFALHDYFNRHVDVPTEVVGVDRNVALLATCTGIANTLGTTGLEFVASGAEDYDVGTVDVLVALHACDTATDDALYKAVAADASVVMVVPCCQKEIRPQFRAPVDELPMLKHDTFKDRASQMLTDALRGLLMESQGYHTRIIEFISDAHTHRNVMILAVKSANAGSQPRRVAEISALKARYGIQTQRLETLLQAAGRLPPP